MLSGNANQAPEIGSLRRNSSKVGWLGSVGYYGVLEHVRNSFMFPVDAFSAYVLSTRLYLSLFRVLYSVTVTLWLLVTLNAILVVLVERIWVGYADTLWFSSFVQ